MAKKKGLDINGVILLDKEEDMSSNQALQRLRHTINARKGGHTGTLDPFATGLLVCCFGAATKICGHMLEADKRYRATLKLGTETDSGDLTGTVTQQSQAPLAISPEQLQAVLQAFTGDIEQLPPMYSALKRDGRPLYEYARQGIELEREPRKVTIYNIALLEHAHDSLVIDVHCSKGTYIRTLAQDIGRRLGCFAHLTALRRLSVGPFELSHAHSLKTIKASPNPCEMLIPLQHLPHAVMPEKLLKRIDEL
ncbi:tRNA pseudouridine(55) synthase TruB [Brackiella oedipodis]|uniref:tRNA pseudouridine(55) synthase TruB n=1 Tax=Brackiella oedipodis TaxID=124225 RepID=UPI0004916471|nr:tRNA pseudouridine(55) synthase TruB [Brackiella oedipodis]